MAAKKVVSLYDPIKKAYCDVAIEAAKKFIESAKEAEKKIAELEAQQ